MGLELFLNGSFLNLLPDVSWISEAVVDNMASRRDFWLVRDHQIKFSTVFDNSSISYPNLFSHKNFSGGFWASSNGPNNDWRGNAASSPSFDVSSDISSASDRGIVPDSNWT